MSMTEADAIQMLEGNATPTSEAQPAPTEVQGTTESVDSDSFSNIDPQTLPPELKAIYNNMLTDYRSKTTEVAPWRKAFDGLEIDDPTVAREAFDAWNRLQSDGDFAMDVYNQLDSALREAGLLAKTPGDVFENNEVEDPDPVSDLRRELNELKQQRQFDLASAEMQRQEMAIRKDKPEWDDDDMDQVMGLAAGVTNGNLLKAAEMHQSNIDRLIGRYVNAKGSAPMGGQPIGSAPAQEKPQDIETTDDAYKIAKEMWNQVNSG